MTTNRITRCFCLLPALLAIFSTTADVPTTPFPEPAYPSQIPGHGIDEPDQEIPLTEAEQAWINAHPNIRVGIDPEFAPFEYMEHGEYSGMASDYIQLLNQRLNLNMQIVKGLSWDEVIRKTQTREIDVLPAVGKTKQRQQYLNYTEPYLRFHRVIITRNNTPFIMGLDDLDNMKVAVQINSSHHGFLLENSNITPVTFNTLKESVLALSGGKVDALVGNVASSTYWIRKLNLSNLKVAAPVSHEVQDLHFAVRSDWPELVSILQKGLNSVTRAQQKAISEKWLYVEYEPTIDYSLLWKAALVFSTVIAIILLWNISLNRQVKQRSNELLRHAHYDQLTGLPNRFLILDRMSHLIDEAQRRNTKLAMLSIDLDDFKKINDTFGHHAGDEALVEVANNLRSMLQDNYLLGRLGGDQFLAILSPLEETSDAAVMADSLLKELDKTITVDNRDIAVTASVGIAIYPHDGETAEELLKNADSATHHTKMQGHGAYAFFTENIHKNISRKLKLEEQMRIALKNEEFYVVYQPKVDAVSRRIIGFEALLRWENAILGEVYPDEFIPVAENNGLIVPIGFFVLQTALNMLLKLQRQIDPSLTMAINFSPRQFRSKNLIHQILTAIQRAGIDCQSIEFEITEGVLLSGHPNVDTTLKNLNSLGVKLAMDDFGTGYSSMSYLRKYTFDILKIDREFIHELESHKADQQLVLAIIAMAHNLDMKVVAEGVETEEQYSILKKFDCDVMQGWLFGKPMLADKVFQLLRNDNVYNLR